MVTNLAQMNGSLFISSVLRVIDCNHVLIFSFSVPPYLSAVIGAPGSLRAALLNSLLSLPAHERVRLLTLLMQHNVDVLVTNA